MKDNKVTVLHQTTDADKEMTAGNIKVTREDWINVALDKLISDGIDQVKVLSLAKMLDVSRSSFYWYFKSRQDLLDTLLNHWESTNTAALIDQTAAPSATITQSVFNFFKCFTHPHLFNNALDFAIREWARRSGKVRRILDLSDQKRLDAIGDMFLRHGYGQLDAMTRARVLYYMQIGYNTAELNEPMEQRIKMAPSYVLAFTGKEPSQSETEEFFDYAYAVNQGVKK